MAQTDNTATSRIEWPTLALLVGWWVTLLAIVFVGDRLPTVVQVVVLAVLGGLYGSLQHEVIHRHPTPWQWLNRAMVVVPCGLTIPYERYRLTHTQHHECDLTDPESDPESYYVTSAAWARSGALRRAVLRINRTLAGRLTIGPLLNVGRFWYHDVRAARHDHALLAVWARHLAGAALVVAVIWRSPLPLWTYVVGLAYGGLALNLLRSFVEHSATIGGERTAVVRSGRFFSLLFLNNNLHIAHHDLPSEPWYRLRDLGAELDIDRRAEQGAGFYRGYIEVARRYGLRPFGQAVYPASVDA